MDALKIIENIDILSFKHIMFFTYSSHFTTSDASAPKNLSFFERGTKRLLLKFVSMSKRRTAYVELSANGPLVENVIEGVFLQIQCPVREADENKVN